MRGRAEPGDRRTKEEASTGRCRQAEQGQLLGQVRAGLSTPQVKCPPLAQVEIQNVPGSRVELNLWVRPKHSNFKSTG